MSATLAVGDAQGQPGRDGLLRDEPLLLSTAPSTATSKRKKGAAVVGAVFFSLAIIALALARHFGRNYTTQGQKDSSGTLYLDGVGQSHWQLFDWTSWRFDWDTMSWIIVEDAPQILIFDDVNDGGHRSHGHSSSEHPGEYTTGYAWRYDENDVEEVVYDFAMYTSPDLDWTDPGKISFSIDGGSYDLSEGSLFLIRTNDGISVQQIDVDMPIFRAKDNDFHHLIEAVHEFAASNEDILAFLKGTSDNQNRK
jgi:hypothetical protein